MFLYNFAQLGNRGANHLNGIGKDAEFLFGFNNQQNIYFTYFNFNHEDEMTQYHASAEYRTSFKLSLYTEYQLNNFEGLTL